MPRISLVTPTFRQAATLRETIESVLGQDHRDLEYWVIDAGSQDGTVEMLREYEHDPRFHWISEPDKGQSDAINKGLARSTGEIFNWINSDDYLEPGALARVAGFPGAVPKKTRSCTVPWVEQRTAQSEEPGPCRLACTTFSGRRAW